MTKRVWGGAASVLLVWVWACTATAQLEGPAALDRPRPLAELTWEELPPDTPVDVGMTVGAHAQTGAVSWTELPDNTPVIEEYGTELLPPEAYVGGHPWYDARRGEREAQRRAQAAGGLCLAQASRIRSIVFAAAFLLGLGW